MPATKNFFTETEQQEIIRAIQRAEALTSGEIRVHLEEKSGGHVLDRAAKIFNQLKMHETAERNGVLIYLAIKDKQFAIIGDEGINKKVKENFWDEIKEVMQQEFIQGRFMQGIIYAVEQAGEKLRQFFPLSVSDKNELTDELSFNDD